MNSFQKFFIVPVESVNNLIKNFLVEILFGKYQINAAFYHGSVRYFKQEYFTDGKLFSKLIEDTPENFYSYFDTIKGLIKHYYWKRDGFQNYIHILYEYISKDAQSSKFYVLKVKFKNELSMNNYELPEEFSDAEEISSGEFNEKLIPWMITKSESSPVQIKLDGDYVGSAVSGATEDQPLWSITKVTENAVLRPNGSADFTFKWSERANLSYK